MQFICDGVQIEAFVGESVAAALFCAGRRILRRTARLDQPRGLCCGMGVCSECAMIINGRRNTLACRPPVEDGMCVESQQPSPGAEAVS